MDELCGIVGIYNGPVSKAVLKKMTDCLAHRGPDDSGIYTDKKIGLGHRRLSILDLSKKGHQPMLDREKSVIISYNGEIYNFQKIKEDLQGKGYSFSSDTDTEVILYAYKEWGIDCIKRFNGMFAFALYDKKKDVLYLVRDRLGIKPLRYTVQGKAIIFASEIKSILHHPSYKKLPDWKALSSYLSYRYVLGEGTFFKGINDILPGHYLEISKGKIKKVEYWDIPLPEKKDRGKSFYKKKVRELMAESVRLRMISDVPVGAYLSGGLDSSIIVSLMSKATNEHVKTYSIGFKQKEFNELKYANLVAKQCRTRHKDIMIDSRKYLKTMERLIRFKDAPLAVPNEIPIYLMSKVLRKDITVVLSGEGADEIFSGYGRLFRSPFDYKRLAFRTESLGKKYGTRSFTQLDHFLFQYNYFPVEEKNAIYNGFMKGLTKNDAGLKRIFQKYFTKASRLNYYDKISYVFEKLHLVGLLERVDNPTMATSVEARVPFVDHKLVEFMFSVPMKYKLKWKSPLAFLKALSKNTDEISENLDITKYILRESFKKDIPAAVIKRKKQGFPVPLDFWFKKDFIAYARRILLDPKAKIKKIIDQARLDGWIQKKKQSGDNAFGQKIWMLVNIELWLQNYF
ncbi:asparagine synthase (glutamine-hydrolyzing) [Candidatus Woesearchaeota archaeon]|nr:asparagine synthase (glutamine-hydrolyzing) [Candidatus Woesearchaeota archaeon]